ncbi:MAG: hypothetical protein Q8R08_05135 [bacterium]|nr:hypothetical protein [bacterium]
MEKSLSLALLPILLGTTAIALWMVLKRKLMNTRLVSPLQSLILTFASATVISAAVYIVAWGPRIPDMLPGLWRAVACGVAANILIQYFSFKAASIDAGEVSLTAPLQAMTPGLITGLALALGEYPSRIGVSGIVLMAMGSYVLLWERTPEHWYDYFGPLKRAILLFKLGHLSERERNRTMVVTLALASACMGTVGLLFDGLYTRRAVSVQGMVLASTGFTGLLFLVYSVWYRVFPDSKTDQYISAGLKPGVRWLIVGMGIMWVLIVLGIQPAYNQTFVAYVGTLKRLSILLSVVLGYFFFREAEFKKRLWAASLIVMGAILIASDNLPARLATRIEGLGL